MTEIATHKRDEDEDEAVVEIEVVPGQIIRPAMAFEIDWHCRRHYEPHRHCDFCKKKKKTLTSFHRQ